MKRLAFIPLLFLLCLSLAPTAQGAEGPVYTAEGFPNTASLFDGKRNTYTAAKTGGQVTVTCPGGAGGLYIEFDRLPQPWTLSNGETSVPCGEKGFLHEYVDLSAQFTAPPEALTLSFPEGTVIADIYALPAGEPLPDWVQTWEAPYEEADLLLLSSHSDDEQLFFAGVLPYYAVERQLRVQVAYLVQHFEANGVQDHQRPHEQLDGLWTVGVRHYPLISGFPDLYSESKDRSTALKRAIAVYEGAGDSYEDFVGYIAGCIRQCKPLVVVSHDFDGEYGHGTHVLCADALQAAITAAGEGEDPWTAEKAYSHLYAENQIVMDWDTPYESLGGKTPFQVTQDGFACHKSQHWTWFYGWIYGKGGSPITKASQVKTYSPCQYGLYHTTVGPDETGGDFFENVETYAQRYARIEAERAEAERLAAEQAAKEEAERQEAERLETERQAAEQLEAVKQAAAQRKRLVTRIVLLAAGAAAAVLLAGSVIWRKRR